MNIAKEIPKQNHSINRVVYIFGEPVKEPITRITPTHLTKDVILQLQQADDIVTEILQEFNLLKKISQAPVISFPVGFEEEGKRSIALRTIITNDFMTGVPAVPGKDIPDEALDSRVSQICEIDGITRVVYLKTSSMLETLKLMKTRTQKHLAENS